ncbi:MAG: hypothetical protein M1823_001424 [Watsoniomyces obsoletus]|nr:MAG: hypothetical protein M1823_001424 [Watsoniomyces obsoletus]
MAPPGIGTGPLKATFAKVAAMAPSRQSRQPPPVDPGSGFSSLEVTDSSTTNTSLSSAPLQRKSLVYIGHASVGAKSDKQSSAEVDVDVLTKATETLQVEEGRSGQSGVRRESGRRRSVTQSHEGQDVESGMSVIQPPTSAISTKPSSVDGRSAVSGATFGEKESLRPDDSASIKAIEDDDDADVGSDAGVESSRPVSRRDEGEPSVPALPDGRSSEDEALVTSLVASVEELPSTVVVDDPTNDTPAGDLPSALAGSVDLNGSQVPLGLPLEPDVLLVEALDDPRDRMFVLHLEQDFITFINNLEKTEIELAPCNSFRRLLTHKLADYYALRHHVGQDFSSVRIIRTPSCRLPPPLTDMSNPPTTGNTPPPMGPSFRIMRRDAPDDGKPKRSLDGSTVESEQLSRTGSMVSGGDGIGGRNADPKERSNLTREEREVKYREARERIFKDFAESTEVGDEQRGGRSEASKHTSRSSSRTGRGRNNGRGNRNNYHDDDFEARSQFTPYYPPMQPGIQHYPGMNTYGGQGMVSVGGGAVHGLGGNGVAGYQAPSAGPMSPHLQPNGNGAMMAPRAMYSDVAGYDSQGRPYSRTNVGPEVSGYSSGTGSGYPTGDYGYPPFSPVAPGGFPAHIRQPPYSPTSMGNNQQWPVSTMPHPYSTYDGSPVNIPQAPMQDPYNNTPAAPPTAMHSAYPYGKLPTPADEGYGINPQHPLPGSFNRRALNPQTQPFVPGQQRSFAERAGQRDVQGGGRGRGRGQPPYQKTRTQEQKQQSIYFDHQLYSPPPPHHQHRHTPSVESYPDHYHVPRSPADYSPPPPTGPVPHHLPSKPENHPMTSPPWYHPANLPAKPPASVLSPVLASPRSSSSQRVTSPRHAGVLEGHVNGSRSPQVITSGPVMHGGGSPPAR